MSDPAYRGLPEPMIALLLEQKLTEQPNAIVESIEGSTGIPRFADAEALAAAVHDMRAVARIADERLRLEFPSLFNGNGNGKHAARDAPHDP